MHPNLFYCRLCCAGNLLVIAGPRQRNLVVQLIADTSNLAMPVSARYCVDVLRCVGGGLAVCWETGRAHARAPVGIHTSSGRVTCVSEFLWLFGAPFGDGDDPDTTSHGD